MSMSDYLEDASLKAVYRGTAHPAPPAGTWVALFTGDPTDAGTGPEATTPGGVPRLKINTDGVTGTYWTAPADDGAGGRQVTNSAAIDFAEAPADLGDISHFGIFDAATGGNLLDHAALDVTRTIKAGDVLRIKAGELKVQRR